MCGAAPRSGFEAQSIIFALATPQLLQISIPNQNLDQVTMICETPPLSRPTDIIGHPVVKLYVSSDRPDGDVFVYLAEVAPDDTSIYAGEGQLRAGWHRQHPGGLQVGSRVKVFPDLPYHSFGSDQYDATPFADGRILELRFALTPVAYRFRAGHRIRIAIAGADSGNFEMNPHLCTGNSPADCPETMLRIHRGGPFASSIELPVVSAELVLDQSVAPGRR